MPFDIEALPLTIALQNKKVSYVNMLIAPIAFGAAYISNTRDPFLNYPFMIIAAPQLLGNIRLHLLQLNEKVSFYVGETTDYYIYGKDSNIYTETVVGCKLAIANLRTRIEFSKPWLNGYLGKQTYGINAEIGFNMGGTK